MTIILLDGRAIQDHFPGIGRYVFNLAGELARLAPHFRWRILYDPRARNTRFDLRRLAARANVELIPVAAPFFSPREQWLERQRALIEGVSLWHSPYYAMPYVLPMPAVVTLEDLTPLVIPAEMPSRVKRLVYRTLNQLAARRARRILTLSRASKAELERILRIPAGKIAVTPLAADPQFAPASPAQVERVRAKLNLPRVYALYVGSNKPHKNLVRLIAAWALIQDAPPLVIAGAWDPRFPEAKREVARLKLEHRVLFRHNPDEADLPALISGARIFVFPSLHEGFGLPPLEAMACGTPTVCAYSSSLPEVLGNAALAFDPWNIEDMALTLQRALEQADLRWELRAKGLQQAQRFSWEHTARETLRVYEGILG